MYHRSRVIGGPGFGVVCVLALTWLLIAAAAWSLPAPVGERSARTVDRTLEDMRLQITARRFDAALTLADALDTMPLDPAVRLSVEQMRGYAHASQGRYAQALAAYQAVLEQAPAADARVILQAHYTAAQLCFALERFDDAVTHLRAWQARARAGDAAFGPYILLGQAYFKVHEYPGAISSLEAGLARAELEGEPIREHWLRLLHHLYVEQQRWGDAVGVLERLVRLYPSPEYDDLLVRTRARSG